MPNCVGCRLDFPSEPWLVFLLLQKLHSQPQYGEAAENASQNTGSTNLQDGAVGRKVTGLRAWSRLRSAGGQHQPFVVGTETPKRQHHQQDQHGSAKTKGLVLANEGHNLGFILDTSKAKEN
jgi:hypothetical protein